MSVQKDMANAIRILTMDSIEQAQSGHPGMPMGFADVATVLFQSFVKHNPQDPQWPNRDRVVLSAGHGSMLLYSLLHLMGYELMTLDQLKKFRQWGSCTPGHPEHGIGIETTTGPLAQGLANAVGMALAEKMMSDTYDFIDHRTYALVGDGCLMEGLSYESVALAGHWRLSKLIVLFDDNQVTIDGPTDLSTSENILQRFQACHWSTRTIDGHSFKEIEDALHWAQKQDRPCFIACRTIIGYGCLSKQGRSACHGSPLGSDEVAKARTALNWTEAYPFVIPENIKNAWHNTGKRWSRHYAQWCEKVAAHPLSAQFWRAYHATWQCPDLTELEKRYATERPLQATRTISGQIIHQIKKTIPLVRGSCDLGGSNQMDLSDLGFSDTHPEGRYVHYGVREHAMAAIMNGIALHKGLIPCGGTFLCFSDYARPAIRLSALMGLQVIYIMTHDSIGLGEDGPTHQPIEHLASLRAIPNLFVFRPCDAMETVQCWSLALSLKNAPSVLCLTRQKVPSMDRCVHVPDHACAMGAYILQDAPCPVVDLWATGSEVSIACQVRSILQDKGYATRVISMPCWRLFDRQPDSIRAPLLEASTFKVAIEAASFMGWHQYVGSDGLVIAMDCFGASAPGPELYRHFGFDPVNIADKVVRSLFKGASSE